MTLDYGTYGISLMMANAGFISSTVGSPVLGILIILQTRLPVRGIKVVEGLGVEVVAAVDAML